MHRSLPIYSGGLGALAGDILKEASDLAVPLTAVGLMYRQGYFRQRIDAGGWQHEYWVDTDPEHLPAALVRGDGRRAADHHGADPRHGGRRADLARRRRPRRALPARHAAAGELPRRALDHLAPVHRRPGRAARPVRAARRRRRPRPRGAGHRARAAAPQRGPRGLHRAGGGARPRRRARGRPRGRPRAHGLHHPHAGAGGQRHVPGRPGRRGADGPHDGDGRRRRTRSSGSAGPAPTTRASRSASASSRCAPAARPTA